MFQWFKGLFTTAKAIILGRWSEVGGYRASFTAANGNIYNNEIVRACIRSLAEHSSKAAARVVGSHKQLERMIRYRPNYFMNGKDFLYKIRTRLELDNMAFIIIYRNDRGAVEGLYPVPRNRPTVLEARNGLYVQFAFGGGRTLTAAFEDVAILRKDYADGDVLSEPNTPIQTSIELLHVSNEGLVNAIKSTANLRGILKSTKAMLDSEDLKKQREDFVRDYMNLENEGGIASLDSTQEFVPISMAPQTANWKHVEEFRTNIFRYYGVNDDILMSKASSAAQIAFYEAQIEPFLLALSLELTYKMFTDRERGFGSEVIFEANRMQYLPPETKLNMMRLVDRGILSVNEYREILNLGPVEGGDQRYIRKEYAEVGDLEDPDKDDEDGEEEDEQDDKNE